MRRIKYYWNLLWFKDNTDWRNFKLGGSIKPKISFRWQRLFNFLIIVFIIIMLLKYFN